jgi:transposase-like protein
MREEVSAHLGAEPHARSDGRRGYRNGAKNRTLATRVGGLALSVPQLRECKPYHPSMFARWQRSDRALLVACGEMYFQGVSTRNVQNVLQEMCGLDVSSMTVSRVAAELDEKLSAFRARRLNHTAGVYLTGASGGCGQLSATPTVGSERRSTATSRGWRGSVAGCITSGRWAARCRTRSSRS